MRNGLSRLKITELFTVDGNVREAKGHSWKLAKLNQCKRNCSKYFFQIGLFNKWNQLD